MYLKNNNISTYQIDSEILMMKVIDKTNIKDTGRFLNYDGEELPW